MPTDNNDMTAYLTRLDLEEVRDQRFAAQRQLIAEDTRASMRVVSEENRAWFRAIDDQYKDLPGRVRKREEAVFPPPPRARRKKAG